MMIDFRLTHINVDLAALALALIVLRKQNKIFSYLLFFSIFWIYLMGVVGVIIFPFPVDIPIHYFKPSIHWIPFAFGSCEMINLCITGIIDNILLTIPFGFGINFIARVTPQIVFWLAITVGLIFEMLQLVISLIIRNPFRSVDINDVLLNATGVLLGNGIFKLFGWLFSYLTDRFEILNQYIFANISDVIHQNQ